MYLGNVQKKKNKINVLLKYFNRISSSLKKLCKKSNAHKMKIYVGLGYIRIFTQY